MKKQGGGGGSPQTVNNPSAPRLRVIFLSFLPRYLLTSLPLGAHRAPLATLFHPWLANASANTSSPISTGAKRSRAPFAFPRILRFRFQRTTSIAGSKLEPAMVKSPSTFLLLALPSMPSKLIRHSSRDFAASQNNFPI